MPRPILRSPMLAGDRPAAHPPAFAFESGSDAARPSELLWPSDVTRLSVPSAETRVHCTDTSSFLPDAAPDPDDLFRSGSGSGSRLARGMRLGRYRLLRKVGKGAQGDVWKAEPLDGECSTPVALKILNAASAHVASRRSQFRHEAERGARLGGPALLRVLDFGEARGLPFLVMPFVGGTSLASLIRARRLRREGEPVHLEHPLLIADDREYLAGALRIVASAARALGRLHAMRIVHRDVKPGNILVDEGGKGVYLCDLGLGRDLDVATPEQMRDGAGTPLYMAPERLMRAESDERLCDIYSMGVTLYEIVTLDRPYHPPEGLSPMLFNRFLLGCSPIPPSRPFPGLPAAVEGVILKAMARNPAERYPSAEHLVAAIDGLIGHPAEGLPAPHIRVGRGRAALR
ncbi:serine/threonine-protein kinase [Aquisphaera insulae]|uniref:serine/threonine-protein kinase n=1 Tax=Aquisphaera insulae TaxID=2712864 RepID=UPI0013EBE3DB|nr:serine/threonine-protein kinase [Aquisphaera insulae]